MYKLGLAILHEYLINKISTSSAIEITDGIVLRTELRKFASDGLHELLQLRQGVFDQDPELSFGQGFVGLVPQELESSKHQVSRLEESSPT